MQFDMSNKHVPNRTIYECKQASPGRFVVVSKSGFYFVGFEGEFGAPVFSEFESRARRMSRGHAEIRANQFNKAWQSI